MFRGLSRKELQQAVSANSKRLIGLYSFLGNPITLEIMSTLAVEPLSFKALKIDLSDLDKNAVASYLVNLSEFGYVDINKKGEYFLSEEGENLLESSLKTIYFHQLNEEDEEKKLEPVFARIFGGKEIDAIKQKHSKLTGRLRLGIGARLRTSERDAME